MREYLEFETTPSDENCVQVSRNEDYMPKMREEAVRFKTMLEARFPDVPGFFSIKSCPHDFGSYLELRYNYNGDSEEEIESCNFVESNMPLTWEDKEVLMFNENPQ